MVHGESKELAPQGVGEREMNAGEAPVIGMTDTFYAPGTYQLDVRIRCSRS